MPSPSPSPRPLSRPAPRPLAPRRSRLGWLGPAIALAGVAIGSVGVWYMATARPEPGDVIDTIRIDDRGSFVIRAEAGGGERNFLELRDGDRLVWRALVPRYAGRPGAPGIAWSDAAVSVRVLRSGRAEVFAVARRDASKLGGIKLGPAGAEARLTTRGPVTLTDHVRSYEIVAGQGWNELVAIDLASGEGVWKRDLGAAEVVDGGLAGGDTPGAPGVVWIVQGGVRRELSVTDGRELTSTSS